MSSSRVGCETPRTVYMDSQISMERIPFHVSDAVEVQLQELGDECREDYVGLLLLSWILLLYRGSGSGNDGGFTWGYSDLLRAPPKDDWEGSGLVSDIVGGQTEFSGNTRDMLQKITRKSRRSNRKGSVGCDYSVFFANADLSRMGAEVTFSIRVDFEPTALAILPAGSAEGQSQATEKLFALNFHDIFKLLCSNRSIPLAQITEAFPRELEQIWAWNTPVPPSVNRCIHELFIENANTSPEETAVISWDGKLSYREVEKLSSYLAVQLRDSGVRIGTVVPLCFEKSVWTIVGVLAVMRAGGILVLTDPSQPEERLRTIAAEVDTKLILTSTQHTGLGSRIAPGANVISVGQHLLNEMTDDTDPSVLPHVPASAILYIQFTSGSTGRPKGVIISHRNYTSGALPRAHAVGYTSQSRVLNFSSYAFDVSFDCMLCTLAHGGCICEPSEQERLNDLNGAIRRMNVNMAHMTPSVARILDPDVISSLEVLGLGGESVSANDVSVWGSKTSVVVAYGPSECTVGCTINNQVDVNRNVVSIGKGVGGTTWIVSADDPDQLLPIGAVGELVIEGPIVGEGYLNDLEMTSAVFIKDPHWLISGKGNVSGRRGRLYRTGDLVRYDSDGSGSLLFFGRKDDQVKIRGQRVELGEIEYHLQAKLPATCTVAAEMITPSHINREPILVAFVTEDNETSNLKEETGSFSTNMIKVLQGIEESLSSVLPRYMIPTAYIPLRKMPLLVSCKIDRKKLRSIGGNLSREKLVNLQSSTYTKSLPKTEVEYQLCAAFNTLFGTCQEVDLHSDFFRLGGDSLKAMKLVSLLRSTGISLTVKDIYSLPVLADMASKAKKNVAPIKAPKIAPFSLIPANWALEDARTEAASLCDLNESLIEDVYCCTPLQEGLMALSAKVKEAYVAQRVVEIPDNETASRLRMAFDIVVTDSPILRTRIVQTHSHGLMQVVVRENIRWHTGNNLKGYLETDRKEQIGLGKPLSRLAIISNERKSKLVFVWTIHHALYDGWSISLIVKRINQVYRGIRTEPSPPWVSFIKSIRTSDKEKAKSFWSNLLKGANSRQFPVVKPTFQPRAESLLERYIPLSQSFDRRTTLATVIKGAWALVASYYTSSKDVVFGETLTGRNASVPGLENIEGPTITTVPTRIQLSSEMSILEYLESIWNQTTERIPHEHFGLQHIRRLSKDARDACELRTGIVIHPVTGIQDEEDANNPANGFVPSSDSDAAREALKFNSYALMLVFSLDTQGFLVMASFDSEAVEVVYMERILERLGETVQQLLRYPRKMIGDLEDLNEQDKGLLTLHKSKGPASLACLKAELNCNPSEIIATWIVDPENSERLLPPGSVGELLLQGSRVHLEPLSSSPRWYLTDLDNETRRDAKLFRSTRLAKYRADGTIALLDLRENLKSTQAPKYRQMPLENTQKKRTFLKLWSRVLGVVEDEIRPTSSFFDLGGDSISAMRLVSEARLKNLKLTVAQLFQHRYFDQIVDNAEIIDHAENHLKKHSPFSLLNVADRDRFIHDHIEPQLLMKEWSIEDIIPVRPLQKIAIEGTVTLPRYSVRYEAMYFNGPISQDHLSNVCQKLVNKNEILRSVFVAAESEYLAVVLESLFVSITTYETDSDIRGFVKKMCQLDIATIMPLGSAFVKFFFVQGISGQSCLIFRISHAQYDEICLPILLNELSALYEERKSTMVVPFSSHVHHVLREQFSQSISYWSNLLKDSSVTVLRPATPIISRRPVAVSKTFTVSGKPSTITIGTLPTAAWALCLALHTSLRDVVFGEVVSGRNVGLPQSEPVMGPCWQYVPVRVKFDSSWTALDLLQFVQNQHLASAPFEGLGLSEIIRDATSWPDTTSWFDSVVHQDVHHVEELPFGSTKAEHETIYPHTEPLREWKIQAFPKNHDLTIEIVTFESWSEFASLLLEDLESIIEQFINRPQSLLFD